MIQITYDVSRCVAEQVHVSIKNPCMCVQCRVRWGVDQRTQWHL